MRKPKPCYRKQTGTWYLQLGKRQVRLSWNKEEAFRKYHEIMLNQSAYKSTRTDVLEVLNRIKSKSTVIVLCKSKSPISGEETSCSLQLERSTQC